MAFKVTELQETVGAGQGKMAIHVGVGNQVTWKGRKAQGYHRADEYDKTVSGNGRGQGGENIYKYINKNSF